MHIRSSKACALNYQKLKSNNNLTSKTENPFQSKSSEKQIYIINDLIPKAENQKSEYQKLWLSMLPSLEENRCYNVFWFSDFNDGL